MFAGAAFNVGIMGNTRLTMGNTRLVWEMPGVIHRYQNNKYGKFPVIMGLAHNPIIVLLW